MVKLADTLDLGSSAIACRFKSCHPYQKKDCNFDTKLQSFLTKSADGGRNPLAVDEIASR